MRSGADSGGVSVRIVFRGHAGQCTGCGAGADSLRQYLRDEFLRAIQYGSYLQRSMGRTVPDRWDCSSGLVPGCAAASMAGGEDFACRGDTVPVAQECKVLRDGASIWLDIEGLLQYRCLCGHILDWQTNFADMKHISRSKGSLCLVVQVVVRNTFQDIVGCITKVERARIEIGKED